MTRLIEVLISLAIVLALFLVIGLVLLLVIAAFAGLMGELTARGTREPKPAYPLMYAPPDGIGPAQAKYLFTETIGKDAFVASIMQTAEKGATTLDHSDGWTITDTEHNNYYPLKVLMEHALGEGMVLDIFRDEDIVASAADTPPASLLD